MPTCYRPVQVILSIVRHVLRASPLTLCVVLAADAQPLRHAGLVDATERAFVTEQVLARLQKLYVSEAVAQKMDVDRSRHVAGDYNLLTSPEQFAKILTRNLQAVSRDKHLVLEFSPDRIDASMPSLPPEGRIDIYPPEDASSRSEPVRRRDPCRFVNVAVLAGNVGYVKFDAFLPPNDCAETAAAAMSLIADCDALLLDVRDNAGGDASMVAFLSSSFFSRPVHLSDIYERRTSVTAESWTLPFVPGRRFLGRPIFILTSARTFSAAEEFAFALQSLKRALIVGEASGGGAHPALQLRLDEHFQLTVPVAEYIDPISRTNWEGHGVVPNLHARENVTVQAAYRAALEDVMARTTSADQREAMQREIQALKKAMGAQP